jgi:hypothetical protein
MNFLVDVQKSQWNDSSEAKFTLNFGIYIPDILCVYANRAATSKPKIEDCVCYGRASDISPIKVNSWWKLTVDDPMDFDKNTGAQLMAQIENAVLPFFDQFKQVTDVAQYLESDNYPKQLLPITKAQRYAYASIIYAE